MGRHLVSAEYHSAMFHEHALPRLQTTWGGRFVNMAVLRGFVSVELCVRVMSCYRSPLESRLRVLRAVTARRGGPTLHVCFISLVPNVLAQRFSRPRGDVTLRDNTFNSPVSSGLQCGPDVPGVLRPDTVSASRYGGLSVENDCFPPARCSWIIVGQCS